MEIQLHFRVQYTPRLNPILPLKEKKCRILRKNFPRLPKSQKRKKSTPLNWSYFESFSIAAFRIAWGRGIALPVDAWVIGFFSKLAFSCQRIKYSFSNALLGFKKSWGFFS
jgi:hypothetical protein